MSRGPGLSVSPESRPPEVPPKEAGVEVGEDELIIAEPPTEETEEKKEPATIEFTPETKRVTEEVSVKTEKVHPELSQLGETDVYDTDVNTPEQAGELQEMFNLANRQ